MEGNITVDEWFGYRPKWWNRYGLSNGIRIVVKEKLCKKCGHSFSDTCTLELDCAHEFL